MKREIAMRKRAANDFGNLCCRTGWIFSFSITDQDVFEAYENGAPVDEIATLICSKCKTADINEVTTTLNNFMTEHRKNKGGLAKRRRK